MTANSDEREAKNRQIVQRGFDAWRAGTGSVFDLLADDAKWAIVGSSPVSKVFSSKQEFLDEVVTPFNARLVRRFIPTVRAIYADGDMVIVLWDGEGTGRDGQPYRNSYAWFLQMRDGRIVSAIAFFDTTEFNDFWTRTSP